MYWCSSIKTYPWPVDRFDALPNLQVLPDWGSLDQQTETKALMFERNPAVFQKGNGVSREALGTFPIYRFNR
jgi:hypothetical protein